MKIHSRVDFHRPKMLIIQFHTLMEPDLNYILLLDNLDILPL